MFLAPQIQWHVVPCKRRTRIGKCRTDGLLPAAVAVAVAGSHDAPPDCDQDVACERCRAAHRRRTWRRGFPSWPSPDPWGDSSMPAGQILTLRLDSTTAGSSAGCAYRGSIPAIAGKPFAGIAHDPMGEPQTPHLQLCRHQHWTIRLHDCLPGAGGTIRVSGGTGDLDGDERNELLLRN